MAAAAPAMAVAPPETGVRRLVCVDIYRGLAVMAMILVDNQATYDSAYTHLRHAAWNGWTAADLIFPSFLFLVGVSLVLSFSARLERGQSRREMALHALRRAAILLALGVLLNGFPLYHLSTLRVFGVLQRIALCYAFSAVLVLWTEWRSQVAAVVVCLVGYWVLLRFVPLPGIGVPGQDVPFLDRQGNLPALVDRTLFPGRLFEGTHDPEGLLSTIGALATTLCGVLAGRWLRRPVSAGRKVAGMAVAGIALVIAGSVVDLVLPINKSLWTSSFAVLSAGYAVLGLSALYWLTEVMEVRGRWTVPFLVPGMNAVAAFVGAALVAGPTYTLHMHMTSGETVTWQDYAFLRLEATRMGAANASLLYSLAILSVVYAPLWLLYRKKIFLKI